VEDDYPFFDQQQDTNHRPDSLIAENRTSISTFDRSSTIISSRLLDVNGLQTRQSEFGSLVQFPPPARNARVACPPCLQQDRDGIDSHDLADAVEQRLGFQTPSERYSVVEDLEVLGLTSAILSTSKSTEDNMGGGWHPSCVFLILCGVH